MIEVHEALDDRHVAASSRVDAVHVEVSWGQLDISSIARVGSDGARIHVTLEVPADPIDGWPDGEQLAALLAAGVTGMTLRHAAAVSPAGAVHLVGFLAASISRGLPVTWDLDDATTATERWPFAVGVGDLVHLPPPEGSGPLARDWQGRHAYGRLYWRHGGTFASVTDLRDFDQARYTIDDRGLLDLFTSIHRPVQVATLEHAVRGHLAVLEEARLVYVSDGWVTLLPFRLQRWPMPLDRIG